MGATIERVRRTRTAGSAEMNTNRVEAHFHTYEPRLEGMSREFGRRGDAAFLRLSNVQEPGRWAVLASPGSRWFALDVAGRFSLNRFDDDLADEEVRAILDDLLEVALAFIRSGGVRRSVGRLKFPAVVVVVPDGERVLRRSLVADVKHLVGLGSKT